MGAVHLPKMKINGILVVKKLHGIAIIILTIEQVDIRSTVQVEQGRSSYDSVKSGSLFLDELTSISYV